MDENPQCTFRLNALPIEIRLMIWEAAIGPPRTVTLSWSTIKAGVRRPRPALDAQICYGNHVDILCSCPNVERSIPVALHVCRESRQVFTKCYERLGLSRRCIWVNFKKDTFVISPSINIDDLDVSRIKRLRMILSFDQSVQWLISRIHRFQNLVEISILCQETWARNMREQISRGASNGSVPVVKFI